MLLWSSATAIPFMLRNCEATQLRQKSLKSVGKTILSKNVKYSNRISIGGRYISLVNWWHFYFDCGDWLSACSEGECSRRLWYYWSKYCSVRPMPGYAETEYVKFGMVGRCEKDWCGLNIQSTKQKIYRNVDKIECCWWNNFKENPRLQIHIKVSNGWGMSKQKCVYWGGRNWRLRKKKKRNLKSVMQMTIVGVTWVTQKYQMEVELRGIYTICVFLETVVRWLLSRHGWKTSEVILRE